MKNKLVLFEISFFLILISVSCKRENACASCNENNKPIAYAGKDTIIQLPHNSIMLDGSGSRDPENSITGYLWSKFSGPSSSNIINASLAQTLVTDLMEGIYQFELKVTDNRNQIGVGFIKITVYPESYQAAEIIFSDLEWHYWHDTNDIYHVFDEIYLWISDSTNSIPPLSNPSLKVWVKRNQTSNSEQANKLIVDEVCTAPFWYSQPQGGLYIYLCYPWDLDLIGKKAEVKIQY